MQTSVPDRETAEALVRAAVTGRTTTAEVAAPDAPAAVQRLLELGLPQKALEAALAGTLVVRRAASGGLAYELVCS